MKRRDTDDVIAELQGCLISANLRSEMIERVAYEYAHETFAGEIIKMRAGLPNIFGVQDSRDPKAGMN